MHGYLSAYIVCSKMQTVSWERNSRKTISFNDQIMSKGKHTSIFLWNIAMRVKKYLRIASCLRCGISSFECYLLRLMNKKKISLLLLQTQSLFHLELNFKRRLVVVDEGFENWRISLGWYPLISHSFSSYLVTWWFRPIAYEQKCLIDHNIGFSLALAGAY